jgi:hypothetical protein
MIQPSGHPARSIYIRRILSIGMAWLLALANLPTGTASATSPNGFRMFPMPRALPRASQTGEPQQTATEVTPKDNHDDRRGEITIAQPKIWQYERVNSLLDGLLRDVQGVSMADLTTVDPNTTNGAAVRFVQSMLEIGVKYDQGAATLNELALQNYRTNQNLANAQTQANQTYLQQLYQERQAVTGQLLTAIQLNSTLQAQMATTTVGTDTYTNLQNQQKAANDQVTGLQQELTSINSQITAASTTSQPALPTLAATSAPAAPESANTFSSFLSSLPSGLQQNLMNQLQTPSLPATKRLDNFITLLYERLAREISALQDDLMRDPQNLAFLVQFDVGLYPSKRAQNHVAVVEFTLNCDGCKVYSIYPGQSSYNLANYEGASKRYSFWGNLLTLVGLGISADYRRQEDTLRGDLVQSVYMSGFQEGTPTADRSKEHSQPGQRFGWYYGASPFEKIVTPGIRSTFAIITVPRRLLESCQDKHCAGFGSPTNGYADQKLEVRVHAGWAQRDNPRDDESVNLPTRVLFVSLPAADSIASVSNVVLAERDRLHVLGIEYNPVYFDATPAGKSNTPAVTSPGAAVASASGTGSGSATVTVSGAGTATASSTGTGATTASAQAANPSSSQDSSSKNSSSTNDAFTGCPKDHPCAGMLVKLAEPIDPNLVVTVRGQPLRRVRDWRGRATSILPPAQSASDMPAAPTGGGQTSNSGLPARSENALNPSLLEADLLAPNTWMEVDSHRLLLNISKDLAGDEFPAIQIVDPAKRALFIPLDLDQGFTEVITNGFHLPARNAKQLADYIGYRFTNSASSPAYSTSLRPAGPYAYETFLPLFLPQRKALQVDAYLGETGVQLLIGFLDASSDSTTADHEKYHWLPSRAQVILEDSDLDLAWSLGCYAQGSNLVCDVPWDQIRSAYKIVQEVCTAPPGGGCPSITRAWKDFPLISSLQVWVEQYDPNNNDSFFTPTPARLGPYPVASSSSSSNPDVGFIPWHFESANQEFVKLAGCKYPNFPPIGVALRILGQHIPLEFRNQGLSQNDPEPDCVSFAIPTVSLTHEEVVIEYAPNNPPSTPNLTIPTTRTSFPRTAIVDPCYNPAVPRWCIPDSLSAARFQPYFEGPVVIPHRLESLDGEGRPSALAAPPQPGAFFIDRWRVEIPTGRVDCNDSLDAPEIFAGFSLQPEWTIGGVNVLPVRKSQESASLNPNCPANPDWQEASRTGQIRLVLEIAKKDLGLLPREKPIHIIRGTGRIAIAGLPGIRSFLLPTKLSLTGISKNQFALQGANAEVIDYVSVQGPGGPTELIPAATAVGLALITLPQPAKSSNKPTITTLSPTSGKEDTVVTIAGQGFGSTQGKVTFGGIAAKAINCWNDTGIVATVPAGAQSGDVVATVNGTTVKSKQLFRIDPKSDKGNGVPECPSAAESTSAGTYTVVPLVSWVGADGKRMYQPLEVTDLANKPLTWVVPEPQKNDTSNSGTKPSAPTTTITISKQTTNGTQTPASSGAKNP